MTAHHFSYPIVREIRRAAQAPAPAGGARPELGREPHPKIPDQARAGRPEAHR